MNEHDDIARLFELAEPLPPSDDFAAGVKRAIRRQRLRTKLEAVGASIALIVLVSLTSMFLPLSYPITLVQDFFASTIGMLAGIACASGLAVWLRFADG